MFSFLLFDWGLIVGITVGALSWMDPDTDSLKAIIVLASKLPKPQ